MLAVIIQKIDMPLCYNIIIQNVDNSATFVNWIRQEVIDLKLSYQTDSRFIHNWSALEEDSWPDHQYIGFKLCSHPKIIPLGGTKSKNKQIGL